MKIDPGYDSCVKSRFYQKTLVGYFVSLILIAVINNHTDLLITRKIGLHLIRRDMWEKIDL